MIILLECEDIPTESEFSSGIPVPLDCGVRMEIPKHIDVGEYDNEYLDMLEAECNRRVLENEIHFTRRLQHLG